MSAEAMFFSKCSHFETKQVFDLKPTLNDPKFSGFFTLDGLRLQSLPS